MVVQQAVQLCILVTPCKVYESKAVNPKQEAAFNKRVNQMVNSLETITYYKHHYVRKTGLKRKIKELLAKELS